MDERWMRSLDVFFLVLLSLAPVRTRLFGSLSLCTSSERSGTGRQFGATRAPRDGVDSEVFSA